MQCSVCKCDLHFYRDSQRSVSFIFQGSLTQHKRTLSREERHDCYTRRGKQETRPLMLIPLFELSSHDKIFNSNAHRGVILTEKGCKTLKFN